MGNEKIAKRFNFNVLKKEKAVRFGGAAFSCNESFLSACRMVSPMPKSSSARLLAIFSRMVVFVRSLYFLVGSIAMINYLGKLSRPRGNMFLLS